jgi:AcrR family transcriptional regulator
LLVAKGTRVGRGTAPRLLVEAAHELFSTQGYRATTTQQIAAKAGVTESLIFRYFNSKADLFVASVLKPFVKVLDETAARWSDAAVLTDEQQIRDYVSGLVECLADHRQATLALFEVVASRDSGPDTAVIRDAFVRLFERITPSTAAFVTDPRHRRMDPDLAARMGFLIISAVSALLPSTYRRADDAPSRDRIVEELTQFFLHGVRPPG